ncbi:MAG: hypothetical protein ACLT1X_08050 [Christensenellales bacterium]
MAMPLISARHRHQCHVHGRCARRVPAGKHRVRLKRTMRQLLLMAGLIGCLSSCVLFPRAADFDAATVNRR